MAALVGIHAEEPERGQVDGKEGYGEQHQARPGVDGDVAGGEQSDGDCDGGGDSHAQYLRPKACDAKTLTASVVDVHYHPLADEQCRADDPGAADGAIGAAGKYLADEAHGGYGKVDQGAKFLLAAGKQYGDADVLYERAEECGEEYECDKERIFVAWTGPQGDEIAADNGECAKDEADDAELQAAGADEQVGDGAVLRRVGGHAGDARQQYAVERCGHRHIHVHQRYCDGEYGDGNGAADSAKDELARTPVDAVDDGTEEVPPREYHHFAQQCIVEVPECDADAQAVAAVEYVGQQRSDAEYGLHHDHGHGFVAHQQHGYHHGCREQDAQDADCALEHEVLVGGDYRAEDAEGECDGEVEDHQSHHNACLRQFVGGHRGVEHPINVEIQRRTGDDHKQADDGVGREEHAVERPLALLRFGGADFGGVAHDSRTEAEVEQCQVGYHGGHERVQAVLALTETAEHKRGVEQPGDYVEADDDVVEHYAGFDLIHVFWDRSWYYRCEQAVR